ncbi:uncharacterized protein LOC114350826 [Ostrinia furnacalis]|uniref:uncharacterized protein LOC114350826 n=1 Tax=Ostrinia furnacalis TaxID=93504 RepID=UPI00103EB5AE|nr:uncharacterized protein LOC114350826 [Ostrinia furnacalis]
MWKRIKDTNLFLTFTDDYQIFVTDFVSVWFSYLSKTTFVRSLKDSNILLEMPTETLIQKGIHVLTHPGDLKSVDKKTENNILAITLTMSFPYPFKVKLELCKGSRELFFQKVTQPLLVTVSELKSSQTELCELLNKKDSEIEEYKLMGGEIAIKFLKTKQFNEEAMMSKYKMYEEYFGSSTDTVTDLLKVKLDVPEDVTKIKQEAVEESVQSIQPTIKMEADSQLKQIPSSISNPKMEADSQMTQIPSISNPKMEADSQLTQIPSISNPKMEADSQLTQIPSSISNSVPIKREPEPYKTESQSRIPNNRKRMKKLNL